LVVVPAYGAIELGSALAVLYLLTRLWPREVYSLPRERKKIFAAYLPYAIAGAVGALVLQSSHLWVPWTSMSLQLWERAFLISYAAFVWVLLGVVVNCRTNVTEATKRAHEDLETRVRERTSELARANALLRQEVSERKSVLEKLRQSEELYRSLVAGAGNVVVRLDRESRRTFIGGDQKLLDQLPKEILEGNYSDAIPREDWEKASALMRQSFRTGKAVRNFVVRQRVNGRTRYVSTNWEPIKDAQRRVAEIQVTSIDITGQVERDRQRLAAQRLEALGNMAGGIAHDVNNVLAMAILWGSIAREKVKKGEAREAIGNIIKAAEDGTETMRRLQRFGKPVTKETSEVIDLNEVVSDCVLFQLQKVFLT
jgi:PAS domain S-box-containing protein